MKLYMHPVSTTCRPVMQFIADNNIAMEMQAVDILKGEQYGEGYSQDQPEPPRANARRRRFRLTESATILRYLADKIGSPAYPKDPKQRARVDERLDWFNSNFYRDWGYNFVYPQTFPHLKYEDAAAQAAVLAKGKEKSKAWLQVLNDYFLGAGQQYLCGNTVTIADYFGTGLTSIGELIHCDISAYPNVARWLDAMKSRPSYAKVSEIFNGFVQSTKGQSFQVL